MTKHKDTKTTVAPGLELSKSDIADAKEEGALDAYREGGRTAVLADTGTTGDTEAMADAERLRVAADLESTVIAPLLDLPLEMLVRRMTNDKVPDQIGFETVKGLLHLERSGQNRTGYVKAFCNRLGIDDPREVTSAGPAYTNDETSLSHLGER